MPDPSSQTRERQAVPIGIPVAALIAIAFLFGSTFFNADRTSFDVAGPPLAMESSTHH